MLETSEEIQESHVFKTNELCVIACYEGHGDGHPQEHRRALW